MPRPVRPARPVRVAPIRLTWLVAALGVAAAACTNALPGEPVGEFFVTGVLADDGCQGAVPALDGADFGVELRASDTAAWWRAEGKPLLSGRRLSEDRYAFTFRSTFGVEDPDDVTGGAGVDACRVHQEEQLEAQTPIDDPEVDIDLLGTQRVVYRPASGADCDFLFDRGVSLPCTLRYELTGWLVDTAPEE